MKKPKVQDSFALDKLAEHLRKIFGGKIDMGDWATKDAASQDPAFLSRALAAFTIRHLCKVEPEVAAAAVVDEGDDNGIDAVHYDEPSGGLFAIQSKWRQPDGGFKIEDTLRFSNGLQDLLAARFDRFGPKLRAKEQMLRRVLWEPDTLTTAVTIHSGNQKMSRPTTDPLTDWHTAMNADGVKMARLKNLNFQDVWEMLQSGSKPVPIDLIIALRDWGPVASPYKAYYGRVRASEVSQWWDAHGKRLCSKNLRHFSPAMEVNDAIGATLRDKPDRFWYLNNGITIVCNFVEVAPGGGLERRIGSFTCKDASIVNGAQTYGMIGIGIAPAATDPADTDTQPNGDTPWVQVRIIATAGLSEFESAIMTGTNLQNKVLPRDLAGTDPIHSRLAAEFALDNRRYAYKSNEEDPIGEDGCTVLEAVQALGCATDSVDDAVLVKRNIGLVLTNRGERPYSISFNKHTTAATVWNAVQIMREVDKYLHQLRRSPIPRADLVALHLNRIILHMVFRDPRLQQYRDHTADLEYLKRVAAADTVEVFKAVSESVEAKHSQAYLANLAKNTIKIRELVQTVTWTPPTVAPVVETESKRQSHTGLLFEMQNNG